MRERKTKIDWAYEVKILLEEDFPQAKKVIFVCDKRHKIVLCEPCDSLRLCGKKINRKDAKDNFMPLSV